MRVDRGTVQQNIQVAVMSVVPFKNHTFHLIGIKKQLETGEKCVGHLLRAVCHPDTSGRE